MGCGYERDACLVRACCRSLQLILGVLIGPVSSAIYILMARQLGRTDATVYVVLAPMMLGMWGTAITTSGEAVASERGEGTLELLIAAPAPAALVAIGKILTTTTESLLAVPLTLIIAVALGMPLAIEHPGHFAVALAALTLSTAAVGLLFASVFVLARSTRLFQNVIGLPLWILSGVAFPLALLPDSIRPLSALVALSWNAAVLRASATALGPWWWFGLGAAIVLSVVYFVLGARLFVGVERRVRVDGSLSTF